MSEITRAPSPFKVVHSGDCTSSPTLTVQLSTTITSSLTVSGSLVVNGVDVGNALSGSSSGSSPTWTDIPLSTGFSKFGNNAAQYLLSADGVVFLKGAITKDNSNDLVDQDRVGTLPNSPVQHGPYFTRFVRTLGMTSTGAWVQCTVTISYEGYIQVLTSNSAQILYLDGISYGT